MSELLSNRGFETGDLTGWTIVESFNPGVIPLPYAAPTTSPRTGTYACLMATSATTFGGQQNPKSRIRQTVSCAIGSTMTVSCYIRGNTTLSTVPLDADCRFTVYVDGVAVETINGATIDGTYQQVQYQFTSTATSHQIGFRLWNNVIGSLGVQYIDLDDCSVIEEAVDVAITRSIRENAILDLTGLTVRTGVTIQDIFEVPKRPEELERFPALFILPGDGMSAELETIGDRALALCRLLIGPEAEVRVHN